MIGAAAETLDDGEAATIAFEAGLCDNLTLEEVSTELGAIF